MILAPLCESIFVRAISSASTHQLVAAPRLSGWGQVGKGDETVINYLSIFIGSYGALELSFLDGV